MGERRMMTPEAMARRQAGVQKESNLREQMIPRNEGELQGERTRRQDFGGDATTRGLEDAKLRNEQVAQEGANRESDIDEQEAPNAEAQEIPVVTSEQQEAQAEVTYKQWQEYLVHQGDLTPDGKLAIPPAMFLEKYPELQPNHIVEIQRLQRADNAPVREATRAEVVKLEVKKKTEAALALYADASPVRLGTGKRSAEEAYDERMNKLAA